MKIKHYYIRFSLAFFFLFISPFCYSYDLTHLVNSCRDQVLSDKETCNSSEKSSIEIRSNYLIPTPIVKEVVDRCSSSNDELSVLLAKQKINELYACVGYINSGATIEKNPQGRYYFEIVSGTISQKNIQISDVSNRSQKYILRSLMGGKSSKPLNINDIRGRLEELKKSALFKSIDTTITPIPNVLGQASIHITMKPGNPYSWAISLDNQQSESTGGSQLAFSGSKRGVLTLFDSVGSNISISEGSQGLGFFYSNSPTSKANWGASLERKESKIITEPLNKLNITSEFTKLSFDYNQKISNTLITNNKINDSKALTWESKLELTRTQNYLLDREFSFSAGEREGKAGITSLQTGLAWEKKRRSDFNNYAISASVGLDLGLEALGSTSRSADSSGSDYKIFKASLGYRRALAEHGNLLLSANGQYSNDQLLAAKKVGLGGKGSVRGVDKNITSFDSSIALSAESTILLPNMSGTPFDVGSAVDGNFYASIFADYASGKDNRADEEYALGSLGIGATWYPSKTTKFDISWAKPVIFQGFNETQRDQIDGGKIDFSLTINGEK